jgi:hypothetical protein
MPPPVPAGTAQANQPLGHVLDSAGDLQGSLANGV